LSWPQSSDSKEFFPHSLESCSVTVPVDEDDRLMLRLQSGDRQAFDEIVERHRGPLYGFFVKNCRDPHLAEDLTQEVLLRVHNMFWDYLPVGKFRSWIFRIARNLMIDTVRKQSHDALIKAVRSKDDDEPDILSRVAGDFLSPQHNAHHSELKTMLEELLDHLPEEQRLTFTMFHFADLSLPELAEIMETSVPTTKSRLRLAREKLSEWMLARGILNPHAADGDE